VKAMIAWWDLDDSRQTIGSLREYLGAEGVQPWATVPGLCLKLWIADQEHNRWGALMVWESQAAPDHLLPPNRAAELIGYPPAHRFAFEVEATAVGIHSLTSLAGLGPALVT
jgi:hypothetical protein